MKIIYIGEFDFTRLNASTRRMINLAKALIKNSTNEVKLFGYGNVSQLKVDGFEIKQTKRGKNKVEKIKNFICRGGHFVELLKKESHIDIVIYYGSSSMILTSLMKFCESNNVKFVVDIVEWYDYSSLQMGKFGPIALSTHIAMTKLIRKADGIIAISSFLYNYYLRFNTNVLFIPVLVDENDYKLTNGNNVKFAEGKKHIIYAGTPGKKDLINLMISSISNFDFEGEKIQFHILGPTKEYLQSIISQEYLGESIICHGRIDQKLVSSYLQASDFSVLLRPDKRYAHAGFSTKFVESLINGIPVISNLTGDIGNYIVDGENGYIVKNLNEESIHKVLRKVIELNKQEINNLKENARNSGVKNFIINIYSNQLQEFLYNIKNEKH